MVSYTFYDWLASRRIFMFCSKFLATKNQINFIFCRLNSQYNTTTVKLACQLLYDCTSCNWIFFHIFCRLWKSAPKTHFHNIIIILQNQTFSLISKYIFVRSPYVCLVHCVLLPVRKYICGMWSWWIQSLWLRSRWY